MSEETERGQQAPQTADQRRDALVERIFNSVIGASELLSIYVGDRLGLYRALADEAAVTAPVLADATGTSERYVREWLEQQAVAGILEVEEVRAEPNSRRYRLPTGHDEVLLDRDSLRYMAPLAQGLVVVTRPLGAVLEAFKTGGLPYAEYGGRPESSRRVTGPSSLT